MNNSETKILYQSREGGRGDLCFEENYGSASFFFFFSKCKMWTIPFVAPESFGCSPNRNLNNSAKQTSTFRTGSSSCFWFFSPYFPIFPLLKCQSQKRDDLKTKCTIDPLNTPDVYRNFASPSLHYRSTCSDWFSLRFRQSLQFISAYFWKRVVVCFQKCWHNLLARHPAVQNNKKRKKYGWSVME